ncbi:uncharacterized protein BO97DRAFT_178991 [Aspergillus homomorphus CBS 101889]|uniref:Leucine-rich repeat domain-containing protein n=1 Tax=Aspergillus homomorphus (strain CBS 101889) TaxID=1450537 RepID=A0A395I7A2_ASPHC|nr:hypothetical protein BO97DRAFT_178991 [Aspergillus homomorphus CBS 101889]RAL16001.1 hypothetical protein BO97DRAFT_178991 [Aspergillus homomorphus CBS 101889]
MYDQAESIGEREDFGHCTALLSLIDSDFLDPKAGRHLTVLDCRPEHLSTVARYLHRYRSKAVKVKYLCLGKTVPFTDYDFARPPPQPLDNFVWSLIKQFTDSSTEVQQWRNHLMSYINPDPWIALILYPVPNIERLEWFWGGRCTQFTERLLNFASEDPLLTYQRGRPEFLQMLREVSFKVTSSSGDGDPWTFDRGYHPEKLAPYFRLPSLQSLTGQLLLCSDHSILGDALAPADSSSITHLEIQQGDSIRAFAYMILPCTNLKSFKLTYQVGSLPGQGYECLYTDRSSGRGLRPDRFVEILSSKSATLETLCLDTSQSDLPDQSPRGNKMPPLKSLTHFRVLRHLQLPMEAFIGSLEDHAQKVSGPEYSLADQLPASLETLRITNWDFAREEEMLAQLLGVVCAPDRIPFLAQIAIQGMLFFDPDKYPCGYLGEDGRPYPSGDLYHSTHELASVCDMLGICLTWHHTQPPVDESRRNEDVHLKGLVKCSKYRCRDRGDLYDYDPAFSWSGFRY